MEACALTVARSLYERHACTPCIATRTSERRELAPVAASTPACARQRQRTSAPAGVRRGSPLPSPFLFSLGVPFSHFPPRAGGGVWAAGAAPGGGGGGGAGGAPPPCSHPASQPTATGRHRHTT